MASSVVAQEVVRHSAGAGACSTHCVAKRIPVYRTLGRTASGTSPKRATCRPRYFVTVVVAVAVLFAVFESRVVD